MRILVIRFSSLGDIVLTTGVIRAVKELLGDNVAIDIITYTHFAGVLEGFESIEHIYCVDKGASIKSMQKVLASMPHYNYVIDLHNVSRSFIMKHLIDCKKRYTYNKNSLARRLFVRYGIKSKGLEKHVVEKYYEPFRRAFNLPELSLEELRPFIDRKFFKDKLKDKQLKRAVIHPFASKKSKEWEHFSRLAKLLIDDGFEVYFIGKQNKNDKISIPEGAVNVMNTSSLNSLISYIASADILISTDSGPLHIGIALSVPTIALFGPTTKELGFYPNFKGVKVLEYVGLRCRPCHIHGSDHCKIGTHACMSDISAEEVREHVNKITFNKSVKDE